MPEHLMQMNVPSVADAQRGPASEKERGREREEREETDEGKKGRQSWDGDGVQWNGMGVQPVVAPPPASEAGRLIDSTPAPVHPLTHPPIQPPVTHTPRHATHRAQGSRRTRHCPAA
jgi:hypothetical protein